MDYALWKHILAQNDEIQEHLKCGAYNRLVWKTGGPIGQMEIWEAFSRP